jgi:tight adherence protein B
MGAYELLIYGSVAGSAGCAALVAYPLLARLVTHSASRIEQYQQERVEEATKRLDDIFLDVKPTWMKVAYGIGPLASGLLAYVVFQDWIITGVGAVAGILLPDFWVRYTRASRRRKFQAQLVDALFILSSSLRAGLSLTQAFEQLESEMPPPASQEFGLMMKAHRLGRTLEEALQGLNERMPCDELHLITTALLVGRETGGDVTAIINQLITTIRERKKLSEKVKTLTLQGRLQAYIMSALPVIFAFFVRTFNPRYFDALLNETTGQIVIVVAVLLWLVGMALLMKVSKVNV